MLLCILQVTVHLIPAPSIVLSIQMYFSALFVKALKELQVVEADNLEWGKVSCSDPSAFLTSCALEETRI